MLWKTKVDPHLHAMYITKNFCMDPGFQEVNMNFTTDSHAVRISFSVAF